MKTDFNNGMFIGIFVAVIIVLMIRKKRMKNNVYKYDERQELLRGRAYKASFMAIIYFIALVIFAEFLFDRVFFDHWTFGILTIIVGVTVNVVYSIFCDSYFYVNMDKKRYTVFLAIVGVINLVSGIMVAKNMGILENGMISFRALNLFVALMLAIMLGAIIIKERINRKEEIESEES